MAIRSGVLPRPLGVATRATRNVRRRLVHKSLPSLFTTPVIYAQALPLLLLDIFVTAYQWACFPIYGIERVKRGPYFALDRHRLAYLNVVEKLNCTYCGYANGVIAYVREVTARTEAYWCPIKHSRRVPDPHGLYESFIPYGDARGYREGPGAHRQPLKQLRRRAPGRRP